MTTAKLIGLVGYKGAGKTTVTDAAIMADIRDPLHISRLSFSTPITDMLLAFGIPHYVINDKKLWDLPLPLLSGKTLRHAAQTLGTEWGRNCIAQDVWFNIGLANAVECLAQDIGVIFDNVRFPDEFKSLHENGGILIAFHRPGMCVDLSHESERHIAALQRECDIAFDNEGNFGDVALRWRTILAELNGS